MDGIDPEILRMYQKIQQEKKELMLIFSKTKGELRKEWLRKILENMNVRQQYVNGVFK